MISFDIRHGEHMNLLHDDVFKVLRGWITAGLVAGLWLGTPSNGMSRARRGPPGSRMPRRLRDAAHPEGLPDLTGTERETLLMSNGVAARAQSLIDLAYARGIPGGEENPLSSFL